MSGVNKLIDVLEEVIEDLMTDYLNSRNDESVRIKNEVFNTYYEVKEIGLPDKPSVVGFVDAGFKPYKTDVSMIIPLRLGALLRMEDGRLLSVKEALNRPSTEGLVLYSSRRAAGEGFEFRVKVRSSSGDSLLFERPGDDAVASQELSRFVREFISSSLKERPGFFTRFTLYIEGLIELAYAVRLLEGVKREAGIDPKCVVLDGTLIKWFAVKRGSAGAIDGINVLSVLTGLEPSSIKDLLWKVVGLSKTSKFTSIARSYSLFRKAGLEARGSRGLYTLPDVEGGDRVCGLLSELLTDSRKRIHVEETVKILNRIVYDRNGVYVARFPLTPDRRNVFMLDVHTPEALVSVGDGVKLNINAFNQVRQLLEGVVSELFRSRSKIVGEPPCGYMEVDRLVRFGGEESRSFEKLLISLVSSELSGELSEVLTQVFSSTTRMRYGYR